MFDKEKFAELLRLAMGERSINQYALNSDISATYISKLLRGLVDKAPGVEVIKKVALKAHNGVSYENLMMAAGHLLYDKFSAKDPEVLESDEPYLNNQIRTIAAHSDKQLTEEERQKVEDFAKFLISQRVKK